MTRVVDLSWPLNESLQVEVSESIKFVRDFDYPMRGFRSHWIQIHNHNGTHVDAPMHTEPGGASIDQIDPHLLYGECAILDLTYHGRPNVEISLEAILEAEGAVEGGLRPGDFVILRTDWYKKFGTSDYYINSPYLSAEAAKYLVDEKQVRGLGYDFSQEGEGRDHDELQARIDHGELAPGEGLVIHHIVLGSGLYQVEHMTNLAALRKTRFKIVVAPLHLEGLEAASARVFAFEE